MCAVDNYEWVVSICTFSSMTLEIDVITLSRLFIWNLLVIVVEIMNENR